MKRATAVVAVSLASLAAHAGRPLTTEDAVTLEDKACQVESWVDHNSSMTTAWAVPACNFGWGVEWQAGFARTHDDVMGTTFSQSYFQAKKVISQPTEGGWGYGVVAGLTRFPHRPSHRGWQDPYVIMPVTWTPDAPTSIHLNIGWSRDADQKIDTTLWGVAGERQLNDRVALVGEIFGDDRTRPFMRIGGRFTAFKGLDFDLTYVARAGGTSADRYISVGLTWATAPFLP
ncbi:MAG TPA: hypothetical protein VHP62_07850 [Usitatibacter sp.]|nr:hypothetical protein [Usitatibacter sp.]